MRHDQGDPVIWILQGIVFALCVVDLVALAILICMYASEFWQ